MKTAFSGLRHCAEGIVHLFFTLILGLALVPAAMAVTSQSFKVSATIVPGCAVSTGSGGLLGTLNFGTHTGVEHQLRTKRGTLDRLYARRGAEYEY